MFPSPAELEATSNALGTESEDGYAPAAVGPAPQVVTLPSPAVNFLLGDFSRRIERQSWRIRHEEERRRLKQKFEVRDLCKSPSPGP